MGTTRRQVFDVGGGADPLFDGVFGESRPNQVVAYMPAPEQDLPIPLLADRPQIRGKATACVMECGFSFA